MLSFIDVSSGTSPVYLFHLYKYHYFNSLNALNSQNCKLFYFNYVEKSFIVLSFIFSYFNLLILDYVFIVFAELKKKNYKGEHFYSVSSLQQRPLYLWSWMWVPYSCMQCLRWCWVSWFPRWSCSWASGAVRSSRQCLRLVRNTSTMTQRDLQTLRVTQIRMMKIWTLEMTMTQR